MSNWKEFLGLWVVLGLLCFGIGTCHGATGFGICKLQGGCPTWWGQITPAEWSTMSSATLAWTPDMKYGLCLVTGPAATVTKVAGLADVLPIGLKSNMNANVPLATRTAINNWLTNKGYSYQVPAGTTALQLVRRIGKVFQAKFDDSIDPSTMMPDPDDPKVQLPK